MKLHVQITRCILARCRVSRFVVAFEHICEFAERAQGGCAQVPFNRAPVVLSSGYSRKNRGGGAGAV